MLPLTRGSCPLSIHRQIMMIAWVPALVVTSFLIVVVYQGNLQHNQRLLDQHGQLLATQLAGALEYGLATGALEQLPAIVDATIQPATAILGTPVRGVTVTDRAGRVLYRFPDSAHPSPALGEGSSEEVALAEDLIRFAVPIVLHPVALTTAPAPAPRPLGQVTVELSVAVAQAQWQRRLALDLGLVLLTFTGTVGLAYGIGRRLSSAIRRIATAIQRIQNGDLTLHLSRTDQNELGTLQEGVNLLADTLARGQARLDQELAQVRRQYQHTLDALQVQSRTAEQANQAKSLFLAKVSHEMRTPLYSIQGWVELLLKTARDDTEVRTLHTILAAAHTLYHHISDILDVTQLEKGKYVPVFGSLAVWDELETLVVPLEPLLLQRGIYLDVIVAPDVPATLESDGKAFRAIVANLLANAVKYTEVGGIVVRMDVVAPALRVTSTSRPILRVRVTDTGCGIPADRWEAIFAPFEQVDEALNRRYPGTGLGLSIVKGYCDLLGGRITVASTLEQGSTFTVEMPFRRSGDAASGRPLAAASLPRGWRALVADERSSFRASVVARVTSLGIALEEQALSPTLLATAGSPSKPYDLLIVQNLSALPPDELPGILRGLRRWAELLIGLETGYNIEVAQRLQSAGLTVVLGSGATRAQWCAALARAFQETAPTGGEAAPPLSEPPPAPLAGKTVLVVEDYAINRTIMANQLRGNGARVREAGDGDTAVAMAAEPGLDVILMDIQMPGKDGITAIQDIRRGPTGSRLPILGFTASADKPTHQRILAAGADRVLTKPLSETDLIRAVRRALQPARPPPPINGD